MSRFRLYMQGVASSYVSLAATVVYSLISVPLSLKFLTNSEYGLWGLLTQFVSYLWLIDCGMSPSVGRLLIEHKDQRDEGAYGGLIKTSILVTFAQGAIVLIAGVGLARPLSQISQIPADLHDRFCALIRWQAVITAAMFATRISRNVLFAHQRNDLINRIQAVSAMVGLATLWLALRWQAGIESILWSNAAATVFIAVVSWWCCVRLRLWPVQRAWGRPSWKSFQELFGYGKDVFVVQIGSVLIMAAQPIIVSRCLGLEAVAAWSVGTKAFFMLFGLIYQAFDISVPALSEMIVRGEKERLRQRFTNIVAVSMTLSGVAAVAYATCNSLFVTIWTHGRISWWAGNDVLLGLWMIAAVLIHANGSFIIMTKRIAGMRYVYVLEGMAFVALAGLVTKRGGLPVMIGCSIVCSLCFSGAYGLWRVNEYFKFSLPELERLWLVPLTRILAVAVPGALLIWWLTASLASLPRLVTCATIVGAMCGGLFYRWGIPLDLRTEILGRLRRKFS